MNTIAVPGHVESIVIAGLDPAIHLFRKKMDVRAPQTSLRSLRKLDCVPAQGAGEQWFNSTGIRCKAASR